MPKAKAAKAASRKEKKTPEKQPLYIVGIGGSAGALEAYEQFFKNMPADSGMAFVLVPHLDPTQKGIMPEIIQRITKMQVFRVEDGMKVQPNNIYVIPPNKDMSIFHCTLHLLEPEAPRGLRMPIDHFFRHLAEDQQEKAVCIILSGMGSDGTLGLKAIKEKLGMAMVQDPETAKYDVMPRNAIETGLVDYVLAPDAMPEKLISYVTHVTHVPKVKPVVEGSALSALPKILLLLRDKTGHDFSLYKKNMLYRRIERRMSVHQISNIAHYVRFLQENSHELKLLFKELLIGVTSFFRDPEAFQILKEKALMPLIKGKIKDSTLRVWVPGCATGEEAYSIAMMLKECIEKVKQKNMFKIQIFATDIDKEAIDRARQGIFPSNITADVTAERIERFFEKIDDNYQIKKEIREMIVFAPQNIIMDPPFIKVDLISCRNLLIYLSSELQKKLLPLFFYALNPGGILFLGSSETIGSFNDMFNIVDNKWKIFKRKEIVASHLPVLELPLPYAFTKAKGVDKISRELGTNIPEMIQKIVLETISPPVVVVNESGDIIYLTGRTGKYLEPPVGRANLNIYAMAREGLRFELAGAMRKALKEKRPVIVKGLDIANNGGKIEVNITVKPFGEPDSLRGMLMIVFEEAQISDKNVTSAKARGRMSHRKEVEALEKELKHTKEYLQTVIEEMETSQEELKATNEELQSTNEELQSANEELTTSKEELQSLNEELVTVNAEMQNKIDELSVANNDMKNLLDSTEIATIFLDNNLNIKRFTSPATKIMNLILSDIGRPITHIVSNLKYENMVQDSEEVIKTLVYKEIIVQSKDDRWYQMRIMPYRTTDNIIDGVVITFVDITGRKRTEKELADAKEELSRILDALAKIETINAHSAEGADLSVVLDEIIQTAIIIAGADKGNIQILDPQTRCLKIIAQRGFEAPFLNFWNTVGEDQGSCGTAFGQRQRIIVEDVTESPIFKDKTVLDVQLAAGVRAVCSTPIVSHSGEILGMLSTHYKEPHKPDERTLVLTDLLVRITADIIERMRRAEG